MNKISLGRKFQGKPSDNTYVVINTDEPYIEKIIAIMKQNGHWDN